MRQCELILGISQDSIHEVHERRRGVAQSKGNLVELVQSFVGDKGSLLPVAGSNRDLPIARLQV